VPEPVAGPAGGNPTLASPPVARGDCRQYELQVILGLMLIDWSREFDQWLDSIEEQGGAALRGVTAMLTDLQDLEKKPRAE
jgi:hypothetical protein